MRCLIISITTALWATVTAAQDFDYYVLSLSWSPTWCETTGNARNADQCDSRADFGWTLHGLWPQYSRGYPEYCQTAKRPPSRSETSAMSDIMGSGGLAWHQWKKHGSCSGLSGTDYLTLSRKAYDTIIRPPVFRKLDKTVTLPAAVIEEAFLKDNPKLSKNMITITCRDNMIQEARICLSKTLDPIPCGPDVIRDCSLKNAIFPKIP